MSTEKKEALFLFAFDMSPQANSDDANNSVKSVVKIFNYSNRNFTHKKDISEPVHIKQIIEIDPVNGVFALVMEESHGLVIIRIDLVTGDYAVKRREEYLKGQGLILKHVFVLSEQEIIVFAEPEYLDVKKSQYKLEVYKFNLVKKEMQRLEMPIRIH